jgi:hypothetical protein
VEKPIKLMTARAEGATMRVAAIMLLTAISGSGCTLPEVRQSAPARTSVVKGHYKDVAACIAMAWNGPTNGLYHVIVEESRQTAYIVPSPQAFGGGAAEETTVAQINTTDVRVEKRQGPTLIGDPDWVWQAVQNCGTAS